jgi:hypothetical protein
MKKGATGFPYGPTESHSSGLYIKYSTDDPKRQEPHIGTLAPKRRHMTSRHLSVMLCLIVSWVILNVKVCAK